MRRSRRRVRNPIVPPNLWYDPGWSLCHCCGWWVWGASCPPNMFYPVCDHCLPDVQGWATCHLCCGWVWHPHVGERTGKYLLCEKCLGFVRPPHLVDREWARCYQCGWWEWAPCTLRTICQFCLHKMAMRTKIAFPQLPLNACMTIGEMAWPQPKPLLDEDDPRL